MKDLPGALDEDIDRLLSGKAPEGGGFDDLAAFVRGVQATYVVPPAPAAARSHIAAAAAAAREGAAAAPGAQPTSASPSRDSLFSRWRRRTVFGMSVATMTLSIAAAAIAATATGSLAAKGDLPGPVQRVVAQAASGVGITLPPRGPGAGSSGPGSGSSRGGSSSAGVPGSSHQTQAGASPNVSPSGRSGRDSSAQSGGGAPTSSPSDDHQSTRGRDEASIGGTTAAGHDSCVAYAQRISGTLGLVDGQRPTFVSLVDHDRSAVTVPVPLGGTPDAPCQSAISTARAAASSGNGGGDDQSGSGLGKSPVPTPTPTGDPGHGSGDGRLTPSPTPSPSDRGGTGGSN